MAHTRHPNFKAIFTEGSGLPYDAKRFSTTIGVTISVVVAVWMALPPEVLTSNALQKTRASALAAQLVPQV